MFLCAAFLLVLMGLGGLLVGVWNVGSTLLLAGAAFLAGIVALEKKMGRRQILLTGLGILLLAVLIVHAAIWNYFAYCRQPAAQGEATVIVLGCKVNGEEPSLMLRRRLQRALLYLQQNPQANCVVSGGMGENESYTEAHVMKKYLVENGIEPSRIYEEDRSTNTDTNIQNSLALIEQEGLSDNLIISTFRVVGNCRDILTERMYGNLPRSVFSAFEILIRKRLSPSSAPISSMICCSL